METAIVKLLHEHLPVVLALVGGIGATLTFIAQWAEALPAGMSIEGVAVAFLASVVPFAAKHIGAAFGADAGAHDHAGGRVE